MPYIIKLNSYPHRKGDELVTFTMQSYYIQ